MKKIAIVFLCFAALVSMSFAVTGKKEGFKNLKVLPKNITEPQLDSIMKHFTVALGVKCNFCHVRNTETNKFDFALDGNEHKDVARSMMRMTAKINKKFFDVNKSKDLDFKTLEVTCFTCHGGKEHPAKFPTPVSKGTDSTRKK